MNMNDSEQNSKSDSYADYELNLLNLKETFRVLWEGKTLIILITSFVAICAVVYSLMLTNHYRSESILAARTAQDASSMSQYAGLASRVGINLQGGAGAEGVTEVIEIIRSREFVRHLLTFENVLPSIMAAKSYDASSQELYFDPEIYNGETKTWTREPPQNRTIEPSYLEAHKEYSDMLLITQDKMTGLVDISIVHISPIFAKDFLALIINEANSLNREIDVDNSSKALNYLKNELAQTPQVEIKKSISQLIEAQLETRMMASIYDDYVLIPLEPPFIPEKKSGPVRSLIVILSTLAGGILSVMIVLVRRYF